MEYTIITVRIIQTRQISGADIGLNINIPIHNIWNLKYEGKTPKYFE